MKNPLLGNYWWAKLGLVVLGLGHMSMALAADSKLMRFESAQPQMGVPFTIILYAANETAANGAFEAAFARIAELNGMLSDYDPQSELSRLSRTAPATRGVPVSDDLWRVLAASQELAAKSDGAFDVTVGPYVRLWRRSKRQRRLPSVEQLDEARAAVGYKNLRLDPEQRTAQLLAPNMRLDLGGIAMGYAVDEALEVLCKRGITQALIDASGDIGASDPPPGKKGWTIAVIPLSAEGTPSREILLASSAVTTSGDAFQFVEIDGRRYSHILDPRTGLGLSDRSGVTVIARDCLTADSLATAVSVLGHAAGLELIEATPGAAAFIVQSADDGAAPRTIATSRFPEKGSGVFSATESKTPDPFSRGQR
ncbi:MAG: FAD:protein FMN transferase [Pirellulales bacterium]